MLTISEANLIVQIWYKTITANQITHKAINQLVHKADKHVK